jgi:hypothetical protein
VGIPQTAQAGETLIPEIDHGTLFSSVEENETAWIEK